MTLLCEHGSLEFVHFTFNLKIKTKEVYLPKITVFQCALYAAASRGDYVLLHRIIACLPKPSDPYDHKPYWLQQVPLQQLNELYEHGLTYKDREHRSDLPLDSYNPFKREWSSIPSSILQLAEKFDADSEVTKLKQELSEPRWHSYSVPLNPIKNI